MNPRVRYEMTEEQFKVILDACKPTPAMWGAGGAPMFATPQENANRAWEALGKQMGFDYMTVLPEGNNPRCFTAVPTETEAQRAARLEAERVREREKEIAVLKEEIKDRTIRLNALLSSDESEVSA